MYLINKRISLILRKIRTTDSWNLIATAVSLKLTLIVCNKFLLQLTTTSVALFNDVFEIKLPFFQETVKVLHQKVIPLLERFIIFLTNFYYRPQTKFAKVMFSQVSVYPQGGLGLCPGGFHPAGDLHHRGSLSGRSLSGGVSVQGGLCPGGGGLCLGRGVSVWGGGLCLGRGVSVWGVSIMETPRSVTSGWNTTYWNAFLLIKNFWFYIHR